MRRRVWLAQNPFYPSGPMKSFFKSNGLATQQVANLRLYELLPGLGLTALVAGLALLLNQQLGLQELNPLLLAVVLGIGIRQAVSLPSSSQPGIQFAMKRVLRLAVIFLGLRLSFGEIWAIGPMGAVLVLSTAISTYYLTNWLGSLLHVNPRLTRLIAAGTSVCGASAVVAANAVVDSSEEDVAYAIATVTGFGTLAMLTYPLIASLLELSPQIFGLWCGMSIHEVAQVIATAFQNSNQSGDLATVIKLTRVLLVIPMVLSLSYQCRSEKLRSSRLSNEQPPASLTIPWFVLFFCVLVVVNSLDIVPLSIKTVILAANTFLLCMALAAMGLTTSLEQLRRLGMRPIYLATLSWLFLSVTSLSMIQLLI